MAKSVDIAIMTGNWSSWNDRCLPLWSERVVAAIREDHPLCQCAAIQWSALAGERIMLAENAMTDQCFGRPAVAGERLLGRAVQR